MEENLKHRTIHALFWSFFEAIGQRGVQFVIGIILARLLFPEQFGLIGMLAIFMAVARTFLDSGFGAALVQKKNPTETDICSIFYFNILVGVVASAVLCLTAPLIASFFDQPVLVPLTRAMSLVIVINSFGLIQSTILSRQINFKALTKASLLSGALSGIIGISMAYSGYGVWSLVVQQVSGSFFSTLFLWLANSWRPSLLFSFQSLREMFGFGSKILASGLLNQIFDNIYLLVIGRLFSAADLGYFTRAKNLQALPSQTLASMVGRVTFPVFSTMQNDPARLKRGLKKALTFLVLLNFPMMMGLALTARPLVLILLTEKWIASVPYLQLLCVVGFLFPLHLINLNVLQAMGRSDLFFRLEIIKKLLVVINILVTWRWGISAMIYGMIAVSVISYYFNSYYNGVLLGYRIIEQVRDLLPSLVITLLMGSAVFGIGMLPFPGDWSLLISQSIVGVVVYGSLCLLFKVEAFREMCDLGWQRIKTLKEQALG